MASDSRGLTPKEQLFVTELLKDGNKAAAYRRAGYRSKSPDAHASRLAVKGRVAAEIERRRTAAMLTLERTSIATLGETKEVLSKHLRGVDYDKHLAEMEKDLEALPPGLPRFELRIEILRAIASRNAEAGKAAITLARLKGALDPARKPIPDRKAALDALILAIAKATDGPTIEATMSAAGFTDV